MQETVLLFLNPVNNSTLSQAIIVALGLLILIDVTLGIIIAIANKDFSSSKLREGIGHKASELAFLLIADILDVLFDAGLSATTGLPDSSLFIVVGGALILAEVTSIMEIAVKFYPGLKDNPLFQILRSVQSSLKKDDKDNK